MVIEPWSGQPGALILSGARDFTLFQNIWTAGRAHPASCSMGHNNDDDDEKGTCMLIDVTIPGDRNVIQKEAEKILKYKNLTIEIQHMWNVKTRVIPVIIGVTGTISKSFRKYVSTIPENHEVKELQKTAILGTAHILRKVLM
jgi:hypothetical protein